MRGRVPPAPPPASGGRFEFTAADSGFSFPGLLPDGWPAADLREDYARFNDSYTARLRAYAEADSQDGNEA